MAKLERLTKELFVDRYMQEFSRQPASFQKEAEFLEQEIHDLQSNIPDYETFCNADEETRNSIRVAQASLKAKKNRLRALRVGFARKKQELQADDRALFEMVYDNMLSVPRVKQIDLDSNSIGMMLVVKTDVLYGKRHLLPRTWHRIGTFKLNNINMMNPWAGEIRWCNLDHPEGLSNERYAFPLIAPQIQRETGRPTCWGTASDVFDNAKKNHRLDSIIALCLRFAESSGSYDRGNSILSLFPQVDDSEVPQWYLDTFGPTKLKETRNDRT